MPNVQDTPDEFAQMTATQARAWYCAQFPLFEEHRRVIEEFNSAPDVPITEPWLTSTAVSTTRAAQLALARIGRPTDDFLTIRMAEAFLRQLEDEVESMSDEPRQLDDVVIDLFHPAAGCIPTAGAWLAQDEAEKDADAAELVSKLDDALVAEVVKVAMPALLERIIAADTQRRAKRGLTAVAND